MLKSFLPAIFILICLSTPKVNAKINARDLTRHEFREIHMGVAARLVFYASNEADAKKAARAAFARVAALEQIASDYRPDSEVRRAGNHFDQPHAAPLRISHDLFQMLASARHVAQISNGRFDPTISPLVALWRQARQTKTLPSPTEIAGAKAKVGWRKMKLDARAQTLILQPRMRLDLGGVAKGFAADAALQVLAEHQITRALVELGGDIALGAPPPQSAGWKIETLDKNAWLLQNCAISTSGDSVQWVEIGGVRYSHLVDIRTGLGRTDHYSATVIAPCASQSDVLSSAAGLMGARNAWQLKRAFSDIYLQIQRAAR